jgi:tetratricopeptide (TPR) repeat protein
LEAYDRLTALDLAAPLAPPQLLELAVAAYLVGKDAESVAALIRAHQGFVQCRDVRQAGGIAARLALIAMNTGDVAQAAGWMSRAARLLDECGEPCAERGHLLMAAARQSLMSGKISDARAQFAEAAAIGEQFGDADLRNLAPGPRPDPHRASAHRPGRGAARRSDGRRDGRRGLDHHRAGIIYCSVLSACSDLFDLGRAREWTQALTRRYAAQPDMVPYRGECLVHRAQITSLQGVWPDALNEALLACERLSEPPGQPAFGAAQYQVAEVHRLRGELEPAEEGYRKAAEAGRSPRALRCCGWRRVA